jgi:predicted ATP-dependent serine protease
MSRDRVQPSRLLGRRIECEELDRLLSDALAGPSQVIVLRGDAGVGKSALLRYLSEQVAGWHVLTAVGVESEMEMAYSGLHSSADRSWIASTCCPNRSGKPSAQCSAAIQVPRRTRSWWGSPR